MEPEPVPYRAPAPVEHKVTAASWGAGGGAIVAEAANWALSEYVFHGPTPEPLALLLLFLASSAAAYWRGWMAPHTPR